ncbi:gp10 protein [Listeria floridensis FSL S10-1187]|uniref:Gp10 protein n=1 Tax=Listeria floridensis FSL S10-1187 TaxID=1265817 RepID=A0ABN0RI24_9LIST|nr:hypothetical protein [Listeria floridensis]EUJ33522.1 gp10 protein [Listeria floridensis FSL S10-1187]
MIDILDEVYELFTADELIQGICEDRIKFYSVPESLNTKQTFMRISLLEPPREDVYKSDSPSVERVSLQIDVEGSERKKIKVVQSRVRNILEKINIKQEMGGLDAYFDETKRFVDSRRYSGLPFNLYKEEY